MLRAVLVALILALATARPATAQLRSLCTSPTMDWCMSVWSWDFTYYTPEPVGGFWAGRLVANIELWGSGFADGPIDFFLAMVPTGGDTFNLYARDPSGAPTTGAGFYESTEGSHVQQTPPTPGAINYLAFSRYTIGPPAFSSCTLGMDGAGDGDCYEVAREPVSVPEPSSLLLLASGMLGLGYTGYSRRRHHRTPPARKS